MKIMDQLDKNRILSEMDPFARNQLSDLVILPQVDSTNTFLLQKASEGVSSGHVVLAEAQTEGRGRFNRPWYSPPYQNLYFSLLWRSKKEAETLGTLGLSVAVMVVNALNSSLIQIKWPNDIVCQGRKLAGILIEKKGDALVIGIGINMDLSHEADPAWIGLSEIEAGPLSRNKMASRLISECLLKLPQFEQEGLAPFLTAYRERDGLYQKHIEVHTPEKHYSGVMQGVTDEGELILQTNQTWLTFRYGEVSVRYSCSRS